jgi:UDP-glucuronate 4-epimerase
MKRVGRQRILVTGGAGFIGSHLAEALLRAGKQITIVDNLSDFYPPASKIANLNEIREIGDFEFVEADICDAVSLRQAFVRADPEVIIHLAACAGVRPSIEQPVLCERTNVQGTLNLFELSREFRLPKFIFGSSSSVYGATSRAPFCEQQLELRPISPYAATKLTGEMLAFTYSHLFGIASICLRFFTVYGPRQRPDLAIHKFTALIDVGKPIPLFGDGNSGRDYTYVDDIVAGIIASLEYDPPLADGARFDVLNLGNSQPVKLNELVDLLGTIMGRKALRDPQPAQPGDVPLTWADISKAERLIGYQPRTPLHEGLKKFVSWYRSTLADRQMTLGQCK